jgi:hypothetical protein
LWPDRGDSAAGIPVRWLVPGWMLTKFGGYASYTRGDYRGKLIGF